MTHVIFDQIKLFSFEMLLLFQTPHAVPNPLQRVIQAAGQIGIGTRSVLVSPSHLPANCRQEGFLSQLKVFPQELKVNITIWGGCFRLEQAYCKLKCHNIM